MWTLGVWSRKGGVGKSTIAACLGAAASARSHRVALVDADPQGSLSSWARVRDLPEPVVATASLPTLAAVIAAARDDGFEGAIVDFPGALGPAEVRALSLVDLVLVPTRPTPFDVGATATAIDVAEEAGVRAVVVLSQVRTAGREAADARTALEQRATVLKAEVCSRIAYQVAIAGGLGVTESDPSTIAADEIRALLAETRRYLK